jgi:hypothetical protein
MTGMWGRKDKARQKKDDAGRPERRGIAVPMPGFNLSQDVA